MSAGTIDVIVFIAVVALCVFAALWVVVRRRGRASRRHEAGELRKQAISSSIRAEEARAAAQEQSAEAARTEAEAQERAARASRGRAAAEQGMADAEHHLTAAQAGYDKARALDPAMSDSGEERALPLDRGS
jgi:nitrate/nitrite-specific signal transduction histidine kinase